MESERPAAEEPCVGATPRAAPAPAEQGTEVGDVAVRVQLADGSVVELHQMDVQDAARLVVFHHGLSPESIYLRFFGVHPELTPKELYRFTHVDHRAREALVAVVADEIVGVARFDRLTDESEAEVAFIVTDSWQGRGLGTLLFDHLARRARQVGVRRFVAETLPRNRRMLAVFHQSGLPVTTRLGPGTVHVSIDLSGPPPA